MAIIYTKGTLSEMSEVKSGVSQSGKQWANMSFILDVPGYQGSITKMAINVSGDRINDIKEHKIGDQVEVGWVIYARQWNGKWYNSVDLINIKPLGQRTAPAAAPAPSPAPKSLSDIPAAELEPQEDDLPF